MEYLCHASSRRCSLCLTKSNRHSLTKCNDHDSHRDKVLQGFVADQRHALSDHVLQKLNCIQQPGQVPSLFEQLARLLIWHLNLASQKNLLAAQSALRWEKLGWTQYRSFLVLLFRSNPRCCSPPRLYQLIKIKIRQNWCFLQNVIQTIFTIELDKFPTINTAL